MGTRLSEADARWLQTEDSAMPADTVSLIITEPSDQLSHERLHQLVASSLPRMARFRSRLVGKPLGIGQPLWAEIDDYDPASQIHRATIHPPGGRRELADLIAQLSSARQHRRKTLWEAWSIDGLAGGRWALAVKMSPALNDGGVGASSLWSRLLRSRRDDNPANNRRVQPSLGTPPSFSELATDTLSELIENYVKGLGLIAEAMTGVLRAVRGQVRSTSRPDPMPPTMSGPLLHSVFDAPVTDRRSVAFTSVPRADLATVSTAFGGTVTNAFLAACTLSLRAWLQRHGTVPEDPLLIQMPLPRLGADSATPGNPLAVGQIRLPVQLDDPVEVLTNLHTATDRLNTAHARDAEKPGPRVDLASITSLLSPSLVHTGMRLYSALGLRERRGPSCHGSISYVSGQPVPAYCAGAKVVGMHTVAPLLGGCGLNITVTSRDHVMDLSVCACPDNVPAVSDIATGIAESLDILVAAAHQSPRGQGRSVVTEMTSHTTKRCHAWEQ